MRAVMIEQYGGPDVVQYREDMPVPRIGPDDVLVRVACAGINFMDVHTRQGKYARSRTYPVRLPCTLGMEGAGEVVEVGAQVRHLNVGDRVAWCIAWGSYAEYACIPAARAARIPEAVSFEIAAALMFQGCTAHYLIEDVAQLNEGSSCLVHAASGAIGQLLTQMAYARGSTVFCTASSEEKCSIALSRGAHAAFLYEDGRFAERVRAATGGVGVDVVFDSLGRDTLRASFRACRRKGMVINYGNVSGSVTDLDPLELGEAGSLFLTRPRLADHMADADTVQRRADAVFFALLDGHLSVEIQGRYGLQDVLDVHHRIEHRTQIGKAIVCI